MAVDRDSRPVERPRRRRRASELAILGAVALAALLIWRETSLSGLPDVGVPFDVDAFCRPIPDETNAFVLYREAFGRLSQEPATMTREWVKADPVEREWLTNNRAALEIWRGGTERPDALATSPRSLKYDSMLPAAKAMRSIAWLAELEGTRLELEGDLEGALGWYLASLRASRHLGRRGTVIERLIGMMMHRFACHRLTSWAANSQVTTSSLRIALDAAQAIDALTPANSDMIKSVYLMFNNTVNDPASSDPATIVSPPPEGTGTSFGKAVFQVKRAWKTEPERSRRVFRLIVANWLPYCDLPASRRPPVAKFPATPAGPAAPDLELYEPDATSPASARALPPEAIERWCRTTIYAEMCVPVYGSVNAALARERATQARLVIALANKLYQRERGKPPETFEELVGPYLKALPEGYPTAK